MGYGDRYLEVDHFISYCKTLNVKTSKEELEFYESKGLMLPVARVVVPEEFALWNFQQQYPGGDQGHFSEEWKAIDRLENPRLFLPEQYANLTDDYLIEAIDREFDKNPYLFKPDGKNFRPWESFTISVTYPGGEDGGHRPTADHYYSYYQVHQVYMIQQYPELFRFKSILNYIADERIRQWLDFPYRNIDRFRNLEGSIIQYDALSYFMTMYHNERQRTFSAVPGNHGMQRLNERQYEEHRNRVSQYANSVLKRYQFAENELYTFLIKLIRLRDSYEEDEKLKLANQVEIDIFMLATWLMATTGKNWVGIAKELGIRANHFAERKFYHLDAGIKAKDVATEELAHHARRYPEELKNLGFPDPTITFTKTDVDEFIQFCDDNGLDMVAFTLDEMIVIVPVDDVANKERERKFRRTNRYTNLKNLSTSLEYFMRSAAEKDPLIVKTQLTPLISEFMTKEKWITLYNDRKKLASAMANQPGDFLDKLNLIEQDKILNASEDGFWAKTFLIACLARNLSVHTYPRDDWFYGDVMGMMVQSIEYCFLYAWKVARREKWV